MDETTALVAGSIVGSILVISYHIYSKITDSITKVYDSVSSVTNKIGTTFNNITGRTPNT